MFRCIFLRKKKFYGCSIFHKKESRRCFSLFFIVTLFCLLANANWFACRAKEKSDTVEARTSERQKSMPKTSGHSDTLPKASQYPRASSTWAKIYGGDAADSVRALFPAPDGGWYLFGSSNSFGTKSKNIWFWKVNREGNVEFSKLYGGLGDEDVYSVQPTDDGGFVLAGYTTSYGAGDKDGWIMKLYSDGYVDWEYAFGGTESEETNFILPIFEGGYLAVGTRHMPDRLHPGVWIVKLNSRGKLLWEKVYGERTAEQSIKAAVETPDGFLIIGTVERYALVMKVKKNGERLWEKVLGSERGYTYLNSAAVDADGNYFLAGGSNAFGSQGVDGWLVKLDTEGSILWQKRVGYGIFESFNTVIPTSDRGFLLGGVVSDLNYNDLWLVKFGVSGNLQWQKVYSLGGVSAKYARLGQTEVSAIRQIPGGYVIAGSHFDLNTSQSDGFLLKVNDRGEIVDCEGKIKVSKYAATASATGATYQDPPVGRPVFPGFSPSPAVVVTSYMKTMDALPDMKDLCTLEAESSR